MARIVLGGSVGKGCNNAPADVAVVRQRLRTLGFHWVTDTGAGDQDDLVQTIKLFQAICKGQTQLTEGGGVDGKITRGGFTHQWLAAENAPGWVKIYSRNGTGWCTTAHRYVIDKSGTPYTESNGGYGTTWILDVIEKAGLAYSSSWQPDYPLMMVRDCAKTKGGDAKPVHSSHQTGLDIDLRLPLKPVAGLPNALWTYLGTKAQRVAHLYREAVEAQLKALVTQPLVKEIFYEDDTASPGQTKLHEKWSKVKPEPNHANHIHVRIKPPLMVSGQIT